MTTSPSYSGVAVRVRRRVATFQPDLVGAHTVCLEEEPRVQIHAAFGSQIHLGHPTADTLRVELVIPGRIEPVGDVDALAVSADLDHLRAAVQHLPWLA